MHDIETKENIHREILSYHDNHVQGVYNKEKEKIIDMVNSEDKLVDVMKYIHDIVGENIILDMNKVAKFLNRNIKQYKTEDSIDEVVQNIDMFVKSIIVHQKDR